MRALMKTNYQLHGRREIAPAFARGLDDVGYSTR
jgi:hypothetical protein